MTFDAIAEQLAEVGRLCYARGWAFGTSGNFSAVVGRAPLTVAITTSGVDKGLLEANQIVEIDEERRVLRGSGRPSAEDRKSTRLNSSHVSISYAVFCLKKKSLR